MKLIYLLFPPLGIFVLLCKLLGKTISLYLWLCLIFLGMTVFGSIVKLAFSFSFDAVIIGLLICLLSYMAFTAKTKQIFNKIKLKKV
jgi:hypothetical protein